MLRNRNLIRIIVALAFLVFCAAPSILTQEKTADSNIKVQAVNVVVDLIVTDRHGRHVQGLTAADFKVYEDGLFVTSSRGGFRRESETCHAARSGEVAIRAPPSHRGA
jgi:hypothetical protein